MGVYGDNIAMVLGVFAVAMAGSWALIPLIKKLAAVIGALDIPGERAVHRHQIPLLGGVAVYLSVTTIFIMLHWMGSESPLEGSGNFIWGYLISTFIIVATGLYDDLRDCTPYGKLLMQLIAAVVACGFGFVLERLTLPLVGSVELGIMAWPLTIFVIIGFTNAVNLVDGMDGLAGGITMIAAGSFAALGVYSGNYGLVLSSVALAGAVGGFLYYNRHPASIFLGDTGSLYLGFMLSLTAIAAMRHSAQVSPLAVVAILGYPSMDTFMAIVRRLVRGRPIFAPDKGHLHHRLLFSGYNQGSTIQIVYSFAALAGLLGVSLAFGDRYSDVGLLVLIAYILYLGYHSLGFHEAFVADGGFWGRQRLYKDRNRFQWQLIKDIHEATTVPQLWGHLCLIGEEFSFCRIRMSLPQQKDRVWHNPQATCQDFQDEKRMYSFTCSGGGLLVNYCPRYEYELHIEQNMLMERLVKELDLRFAQLAERHPGLHLVAQKSSRG